MKKCDFEVKKSKFISYLFEIFNEKQIKDILENLKIEHKKASHICFAYSLEDEGLKEKCVDDGEPCGTAGKPILNVIHRNNQKNIVIFVVRYFGGVKLGAGGLLRAYSKSASILFKD